MKRVKTIAKNTILILISQIISYIFIFFTTIYSARYLGVENFGILSLSIAFTGILIIFADLGLSTLTIREVSRDKSLGNKYLVNIALFKIVLAVITFIIAIITVNILSYSLLIQLAIYGMTISVIFNSFSVFISSIFQAHEKMEYLSIGTIISSILIFIGVLIAINLNLDVLNFVLIYIIANIIVLLFYLIILFKKFMSPSWDFEWNFLKDNLKMALPFGITGIFVMIYYYIDSIMLSVMAGNDAVGWYNAAYRITLVLLFIPSVFNISIFPAMSQFYLTSKKSLKFAYKKYFKYMTIIGIPLGIGTTLLAEKIILIIFGAQYANSTLALQILVWSSIIIFISSPIARLLEASNKQSTIAKITGLCAVFNIILNLILIPEYSFIGASLVTVLTEIISLILGLKVVSRLDYGLSQVESTNLLKILISSIIMGIFIILFRSLNIVFIITGGIIIYFIILYSLKCFDEEDISIILNILK